MVVCFLVQFSGICSLVKPGVFGGLRGELLGSSGIEKKKGKNVVTGGSPLVGVIKRLHRPPMSQGSKYFFNFHVSNLPIAFFLLGCGESEILFKAISGFSSGKYLSPFGISGTAVSSHLFQNCFTSFKFLVRADFC